MIDQVHFVLTFAAALGCGLIGGVFFAFSNFVMKALSRLPAAQGIAAMQAINVDVLNRCFLSVFTGTAVTCAALAVWSVFIWNRPGAAWLLAGTLLYFVGTFVVTIVCNVPRNEALAAIDPVAGPASETLWRGYVRTWTTWNHVRTIAGLLAAAALIVALCVAGEVRALVG